MTHLLSIVPQTSQLIPFVARHDDSIVIVLLVCFFVLAYVLTRNYRLLMRKMASYFLLDRRRGSLSDVSISSEVHHLFLLVVAGCTLGGLNLFCLCVEYEASLVTNLNPMLLVAIYSGLFLVYLLFKWSSYNLVGWTFFNNEKVTYWLDAYTLLLYYSCIYLFFSSLTVIYFDLPLLFDSIIFLSLFLLVRFFIIYKWIKHFSINIYGLFRLFLYFCALEIVPVVLFGAIIMIINSFLVY